jgi:hypothetical protein
MGQLKFDRLLALYGTWDVAAGGASVTFHNKRKDDEETSFGLALFGEKVDDGVIECTVKVDAWNDHSGAMIVLRANGQQDYYAAGLGGFNNAYTIMAGNHLRFTRLDGAGSANNILPNREYKLRVVLEGQRVDLYIDQVKVVGNSSLTRTRGFSAGLFCFKGTEKVRFTNYRIDDRRPKAFIVMQFTSPYNEVYRDAIQPLVSDNGFEPIRVDDIDRPGIIINDIRNQIADSSIVIADITEANPNVYYEVGMSHALGKPTVLLAQRGTKLPFDVGPHRCIFYDNSIPGRARLQESLKRSLDTLIGGAFDDAEVDAN